MIQEDNRKERRSWWMQFLISVVGTAIGVGLTFAVSNRIENRKQAQAQRITAMMVIHDIDESIETMKSIKTHMENQYNATLYATNHLDQIESLSHDTLLLIVNFIVEDDEDFSFDMSKEKIFHSSPDTWQNLGSMKFIDNVQSFYYKRQTFVESYNKSVYWQHPVPIRDYEKVNVIDDSLRAEQSIEQYYKLLSKFLKEKLIDISVQYYINYSASRIYVLNNMIGEWIRINDENKFLMSITDEEMESYVNSINKTGLALKEESLIGTWFLSTTDDLKSEWNFMKDHTFKIVIEYSSTTNMLFAKGKFVMKYYMDGTWAIEGDSLIQFFDWNNYDVEVDGSGMIASPGRQDMLDSWLEEYKESIAEEINNDKDSPNRRAYGACLDASHDKMELKSMTIDNSGKNDVTVQYLKRKK